MLSLLYALLAGAFAVAAGGGSSSGSSTSKSQATDDGKDGDGSGDGDTVYIPETGDDDYDIGWGGLTAEEQLIVELVNRARLDPDGELAYQDEGFAPGVSSSAKQALAVDPYLSRAARDHSKDMDNREFFAHTNPDGDTPTARADDAGYDGGGVGENIGWIGGYSVGNAQGRATDHHENLWDSDGHQQNFMNPGWSEIGLGYDHGDHTHGGTNYPGSTFVTEVFGDQGKTYLTGVVIDDKDGDEFYDIGEGQGGVKVTAYNDDGVQTTATWDAGGYTLELARGTYTVVFHGGDLDGYYETDVTIGSRNVKLDVIEDRDAVDGAVTASATLSSGPPPEAAGDAGAELMADLSLESAVETEPEPEELALLV